MGSVSRNNSENCTIHNAKIVIRIIEGQNRIFRYGGIFPAINTSPGQVGGALFLLSLMFIPCEPQRRCGLEDMDIRQYFPTAFSG